jgi:hypothetical protein
MLGQGVTQAADAMGSHAADNSSRIQTRIQAIQAATVLARLDAQDDLLAAALVSLRQACRLDK